LTFCFNCGKELPAPDAKFCPNCGQAQPMAKVVEQHVASKPAETSSVMDFDKASTASDEETLEQPRPRAFELGVKLEETVANIFEKMGYSVQRRVRPATKTGATAEIDVLLSRGNRRLAVECKNYDESRAVGVSELRNFMNKLQDTGIMSGVFVTTSVFSSDAEQFAESTGIEIWDKEKLLEKFYAFAIGRIVNPSLLNDPVLPVLYNFESASTITLRNPRKVQLFSKVLFYHPYFIIKYRLHMVRKDPSGRIHKLGDEGSAIVDALDGEIINKERGVLGIVSGLFRSKEERLESKEDKLVTQDLLQINASKETILKTSDYEVNVAEPALSDIDAAKIVKGYVIEKNTQNVRYEPKGRNNDSLLGMLDKPSLKVVPRPSEIEIRGIKMVYVPKWDLQFESGNTTFQRRILASSGKVIEDGLANCRKCALLHRTTVAVCDTCGIPLCEKHVYNEGERWVCEEHAPESTKEAGKGKGLFGRLLNK
jgi:hypothetical protein